MLKVNKDLTITSNFFELRRGYVWDGNRYIDGYHEGVDFGSELNKKYEVKSETDGKVDFVGFSKNGYGNFVIIKKNLSDLNKIFLSDVIYILYAHLDKVLVKAGDIINIGDVIGNMGNTGYCLTKIDKILKNGDVKYLKDYRRVTEEESKDDKFFGGVHLHLSVYCIKYEIAEKLKKTMNGDEKVYFFQWGKYYVNPLKFFEFLNNI